MLHDNLWWRLIAFHILCIVVCTVGVSTWANKNLSGQELIKNNLELVDYVTSLEYVLKHSTSALNSDFIKQYILVSSKYKQYRVTLINEMGEVLLDTDYDVKVMDNHGSRPEIIRAKEKGDAWIKRYSQTLNQQMIYYVKQSFQQQYSPIYIRVSQSVTYIDLALKKLNTTFVLLMLFVILIVIILDVLMINYIHKQLGSLSDRAIELSKSDTSKRIYEQYEKPFRRLADAMNSMARKNERRIQEINKEKNQLSVVLSSLVEGVIAVDSEYKILHVNQSAGEMLGVDFKDADESNNLLFMHVRYPALINVIDKARQSEEEVKGQLIVNFISGKKMIDLNAVRFVIPDMKEYGVLVVLHDVSFQSELDKLRKDFVANASHEIKTPITAIKGYLETIIEDDEISKTLQKKFIGNAYIQVERLAVLSEQLMDLSRSERILQQEPYVQCDLSVLCEEICRQYQQKIPDSLSLQCECPDGITVNTDVYVVRQIVENLLDNAIKYTFYGKILLRLNDYKEEVTISVNDTGIGIETAEQEKIWDRFYRVDTSHNSEIKGHGLGLSIVKHLAKRLGANINVESTFGEGSTFTLSIPTSR